MQLNKLNLCCMEILHKCEERDINVLYIDLNCVLLQHFCFPLVISITYIITKYLFMLDHKLFFF